MKCELVKIARKIKSKDGKKEFTIYDLYLAIDGFDIQPLKILPNTYVGNDGEEHSNKDKLMMFAKEYTKSDLSF